MNESEEERKQVKVSFELIITGHLRLIPSEAPQEPERNEPPNCSTEGLEGGASNLWSSSQLTVALTLELPVSILQGSTYSWLNQPRLKRKP